MKIKFTMKSGRTTTVYNIEGYKDFRDFAKKNMPSDKVNFIFNEIMIVGSEIESFELVSSE